MSTVKVCTHDRTTWITDVSEVVLISSFTAKDPKDPLASAGDAWKNIPSGCVVRLMDFQEPGPNVSDVANVYSIRRRGGAAGAGPDVVLVAPSGSCYLMGESGATIDRL